MACSSHSTDQRCQVLTASLADSQIPLFLRNKLHRSLPYSLPLYRRCQFHLDQRRRQDSNVITAVSRRPDVWLALVRSGQQNSAATSDDWLQSWLGEVAIDSQSEQVHSSSIAKADEHAYWMAAHIDLTEPGQTQVWIFGSWEPTVSPVLSPSSTNTTILAATPPEVISIQYALFQAFYQHLRSNHIPFISPTPSPQWTALKESGKIVSLPYNRNKVLFGTIAEALWWMHEDWVVQDRGIPEHLLQSRSETGTNIMFEPGAIAREDRPYLKYLLPLSTTQPPQSPSSLPAGFHFLPLQPQHLQLMLDRSPIPRSLELLRTLISVGVFPVGAPDPVSWGILSKDASVGSLHTEPEFRGRGFAQAVVRALMAMTPTRFTDSVDGEGTSGGDDTVGYGHTDVSTTNVASRRVFEKMGADIGWKVGWVEVDVGLKGE